MGGAGELAGRQAVALVVAQEQFQGRAPDRAGGEVDAITRVRPLTVGEGLWMLPRNAYRVMRRNPATNEPTGDNPLGLRPMYAKRLDPGEILLVNGYFGRKLNGEPFEGEIVQLNGDWDPGALGSGFQFTQTNLGFSSISVRFELPPIQGTRGLTLPVFADRD